MEGGTSGLRAHLRGYLSLRWEVWRPWYQQIAQRLGLDERADRAAAELLNRLLPEPELKEITRLLRGRGCVVFGAGPSLELDLVKLDRRGLLRKTLLASNGATSAVVKWRDPEIIVTDLDGRVKDQLEAWHRGSWLVVHAHGDNVDELRRVVPELDERVLGTTQLKPFGKLFNFGGFTDGDRAAFLAHELGASKIWLAGMDLGPEVGKYSGRKEVKRKLAKLEICGELLAWLAGELGARMINLTTKGREIPNVPRA